MLEPQYRIQGSDLMIRIALEIDKSAHSLLLQRCVLRMIVTISIEPAPPVERIENQLV